MIYLDNAATTWPKPESVYASVNNALRNCGNPGRGGHSLSLSARKEIEDARELLACLFNVKSAKQIVFTRNATESINLALKGILKTGDHVITTSMEHNAVARPLEALKAKGIEVYKLPSSPLNVICPQTIKAAIKTNTKMIVLSHASNVTGAVQPISEIGYISRQFGVLFLVDAAQTAGVLPIDVQNQNIDLLAFSGHKGLFGPQGTGGLYIRPSIDVIPLMEGGTGSDSKSLFQPTTFPDRYESGTPNTPGISGLGAGVKFILSQGISKIRGKEILLMNSLLDGLKKIPEITIYGPNDPGSRTGVISINLKQMDPLDVAFILSQSFDIAVRAGLHCAPDAHSVLGTLEKGTIRISISCMNDVSDIEACLEALYSIVSSKPLRG